ncbi:MAG: bifunctional YncE family protein/alkaline phosphatase family protein [Actinomycetota bacterium]|nr:bifunctional YncE family protein/alkaline phosphatase family protein [Actinomycetota bacterium]
MIAIAVVACLLTVGVASAEFGDFGFNPFGTSEVGQNITNRILLPTNQWISPIGTRLQVNNARLVSSTLSPDGNYVAALSWNNFTGFLTIMNVKTGQIAQQLGTGGTGDPTLGDRSVAADGPLYSADGKTLWFPQSADLIRFTVNADGTVSSPVVIPLKGPNGAALPSGMALSSDGATLYVALNGNNTLGLIDTSTNKLVKEIPVGNAPRQVVIDGSTAYVSNEGGRPANTADFTNLSDGTPIVSSRITGGAITGTVSVVDLGAGKETQEISVGLQPTALYLNGSALFVANSNDDSMSVIDTGTNTVAQTVQTNPVPGATVGSYANAITMPDSSHVLVSIGRDNAIAVYGYSGVSTPLQFQGLLPTDWYPVQVQVDPALGNQIVVTNDKGIGARGPLSTISKAPYTSPNPGAATGHNTYNDTGSVTTFALPADNELRHYTRMVSSDNAWNQIPAVNSGAYDTVPSVIPERLGGHSPIKHIVVIVKENRTYDQVLGDLGQGNGDPSLTQFGQTVTPNQHALAMRFGTMDNFYDQGTLSADGHNWIVQANANDYVEKEFGAFYRSYPAQGGDALAYQRSGFLWNAAEKAGLSVQDFGEYANFFNVPSSIDKWVDWYKDSQILEGKASGPLPIPIKAYQTYADIPSLNAIMDPYYPKFDSHVPDQYRVDIWQHVFQQNLALHHMPNLTMMWMPNDHTSGVGSGDPYPVAQVADNDLAVGRIVDAISHSRFWKSTAIFVLEDDPQNGVDHVDGHRSVLFVASPYAKRGVHSQYYSQINVVRTIEQILGIQPMNQEDHSAEPMYSLFTAHPNFAPYDVLPNQIPLTLGAPGYPSTLTGTAAKKLGAVGTVPATERAVYAAWVAWSKHQRFGGGQARQDYGKPALLNRLDWYSAHNWKVAYPGDRKIFAPDQVPGRSLPAALIGEG